MWISNTFANSFLPSGPLKISSFSQNTVVLVAIAVSKEHIQDLLPKNRKSQMYPKSWMWPFNDPTNLSIGFKTIFS